MHPSCPPLPPRLCSANDCQRATSAGFNSSACLCNTTLAYLHCNALAAAEAAAAIETALSTTAVTVDPGRLFLSVHIYVYTLWVVLEAACGE